MKYCYNCLNAIINNNPNSNLCDDCNIELMTIDDCIYIWKIEQNSKLTDIQKNQYVKICKHYINLTGKKLTK